MTNWIFGFFFLMFFFAIISVHNAILGYRKEGNPPLTNYHLALFFLGLSNGLLLGVCALLIIRDG